MLSRSELARLIDGPALDREIRRLGKMGGGWIHAATVLSRRIHGTLDWADLGQEGARFTAWRLLFFSAGHTGSAGCGWRGGMVLPCGIPRLFRSRRGRGQGRISASRAARFSRAAASCWWRKAGLW